MGRVRAHFRDGSSELVSPDAGATPEEVTATMTGPSLTGSALPTVDVPLADGTVRPLANVERFSTDEDAA